MIRLFALIKCLYLSSTMFIILGYLVDRTSEGEKRPVKNAGQLARDGYTVRVNIPRESKTAFQIKSNQI